jgi:hypothetical protein
VGDLSETVTVSAESRSGVRYEEEELRARDEAQRAQQNEPSVNVQSLQRRAAGVLPVRIDVPRAGTSHRFVRPLVIDEETTVRFRYRRR